MTYDHPDPRLRGYQGKVVEVHGGEMRVKFNIVIIHNGTCYITDAVIPWKYLRAV